MRGVGEDDVPLFYFSLLSHSLSLSLVSALKEIASLKSTLNEIDQEAEKLKTLQEKQKELVGAPCE